MHILQGIEIEAKKDEVLKSLRENREGHRRIVKEARVGYLEKAKGALAKKMEDLQRGKIVGLVFALQVPQDHTKVYDTAIRMLELDQRDTVVLNSQQVRNLIMDEWDWTEHFLAINAGYSGTAQAMTTKRGGDPSET